MNSDHRFADPGTVLTELATHFVVQCPKCTGKALIQPLDEERPPNHRLTCTVCFHVEAAGHWYGSMLASVAVKCRECHTSLRRSAPWDGRWKKLDLHCDHCGDDCAYEAQLSKQAFHAGRMTDPVFGLPLWLQKEYRGDLFWAYNYEHLSLLRQYIGAKLRERGIQPRNTIRKNIALLSRLPEFIQRAGNRAGLLKLIHSLEEQ